jgi:heme-degrading monooxygenase HmoA
MLAATSAVLLSACQTADPSCCVGRDSQPVEHVVVCWLKAPGNAAHRTQLIEASTAFRKVPGVKRVTAGVALQSSRPVVDDSFDVAVIITFADADALAAYEASDAHKEAVAKVLRPLVQRFVGYDIVTAD